MHAVDFRPVLYCLLFRYRIKSPANSRISAKHDFEQQALCFCCSRASTQDVAFKERSGNKRSRSEITRIGAARSTGPEPGHGSLPIRWRLPKDGRIAGIVLSGIPAPPCDKKNTVEPIVNQGRIRNGSSLPPTACANCSFMILSILSC